MKYHKASHFSLCPGDERIHSIEAGFLSSPMKAWESSRLEIAPQLYKSQHWWLTSVSRASTANRSVRDAAAVTSVARESIRSSDCFIALPHRSNSLGPSYVRNSCVRALYAAFNLANPRLRSSSSTQSIENIICISRGFCYHQAGVLGSSEPTLAAGQCQVGREIEVH